MTHATAENENVCLASSGLEKLLKWLQALITYFSYPDVRPMHLNQSINAELFNENGSCLSNAYRHTSKMRTSYSD